MQVVGSPVRLRLPECCRVAALRSVGETVAYTLPAVVHGRLDHERYHAHTSRTDLPETDRSVS